MAGERVPWELSHARTTPSTQRIREACFSAEPPILQACWRRRPTSPLTAQVSMLTVGLLAPSPGERRREGTSSRTATTEASIVPGVLCLTPWSVTSKDAGLHTGHQWSTGGNWILPPTMVSKNHTLPCATHVTRCGGSQRTLCPETSRQLRFHPLLLGIRYP